MPETTATVKFVTCRWCQSTVIHRYIQRHWKEECAHAPLIHGGQHVCSRCQEVREGHDFPASSSKATGHDHTCKACHVQGRKDWAETNTNSVKTSAIRPGRWVLSPCRYCDSMFSARQMLKHIPRCPENPNKRTTTTNYTPMENMAEYRDLSVANAKRSKKAHNLRWAYNISIEEWEQIYREQDGKCAICGCAPDGLNRRTNSLHLDHNHETGQIRRLLCHYCNLGLGAFRDNPILLLKAAQYLINHTPDPAPQ